jgi:hypothetical protein
MTRSLVRSIAVAFVVVSCHHDSPSAPNTNAFQIVVQNVGPALAPFTQTALDSAVAMWERVIVASLPPYQNVSTTANECGQGFPAYGPATVNDVVIQVRFDSIDGPGKVLGHSGPCLLRQSPDNRTVLGTMTFDTADMAALNTSGHLNEVMLHEMGHVLGFGTLWDSTTANCLKLPATGATPAPDTYYSCAHALAQFDSIGGTSYTGGNKVPVENCAGISGCGVGTYNSHWRESVFFNELMTGYLNNGTPNPLSTLTIAAMADLGYSVNKNAAQSYSRVFTSRMPLVMAPASAGVIDLSGDITTGPIRMIDASGRVVRVMMR